MDSAATAGEPAQQSEPAIGTGLSRRDREILAFERQWWQYAGAKEQAIKEMFDLSPTRYYQVLNEVIDNPAALAAGLCGGSSAGSRPAAKRHASRQPKQERYRVETPDVRRSPDSAMQNSATCVSTRCSARLAAATPP